MSEEPENARASHWKGEPRWWLMRCWSGKEMDAARYLRGLGYRVVAPMEKRYAKPSRHVKGSDERREFEVAILTGYLIVGMGAGSPTWSRAMAEREKDPAGPMAIYGIVPLIHAGQVARVRAEHATMMAGLGCGAPPPEHYRSQNRGREYDVGDAVEVIDGPFQGFQAIVLRIRDGYADFEVSVFGRPTPATIRADGLASE